MNAATRYHKRSRKRPPKPRIATTKLLTALVGALWLATFLPGCGGDDEDEPGTIAEILAEDDRFDTLKLALTQADLLASLDGDDNVTVFAPTNAAFEEVLIARGITRVQLLAFPDLEDRMRYHMASGELTADELSGMTAVDSMHGGELAIAVEGDTVVLNGMARIIEQEIPASNGVIHVLDTVMVPPREMLTKQYRRIPAKPIPELGLITDAIMIVDAGHVAEIEVVLDIDHTVVYDLAVSLEHVPVGALLGDLGNDPWPKHDSGGKVYQLVEQPFSGLDNIKLTLADSAAKDIQDDVGFGPSVSEDPAYTETHYRPLEPLEFTYGESLAGKWILHVEDRAPFGSGVLNSWGLNMTYTMEAAEPALAVARPRAFPTLMAQGFQESVRVKIRRLAGLAADINVTLDGGEGVNSEPLVIRGDEEETTVFFGAAPDATPGERDLKVSIKSVRLERSFEQKGEVVAPDVSGITLLSHLSLAALGAPGGAGNDIWGWTDTESGKEYALVGTSEGTAFVDISTPTAPQYLGMLPTHTDPSGWRDIKVFKDHAFIVSEANGHGMQVFDLTQLRGVTSPRGFGETAHFAGFGNAHNIVINEGTGFAYAVGATRGEYENLCFGGLLMIDINTPTEPQFVGCFAGGVPPGQEPSDAYPTDVYIHDAQCVVYRGPDPDYQGGKEICVTSDGQITGDKLDYLGFADVTDKSNPIQIARATYEGSGYSHQGWLTEDHAYFLLNDELDEGDIVTATRTFIWDVRDLDNPKMIGVFDNPRDAIGHNTFIKGNRAYQANYTSGLRIVDISDIANANLSELSFFDSYPDDDADDDPVAPESMSAMRMSSRCSSDSSELPSQQSMGALHHPDSGGGFNDRCGQTFFSGAWGNYPFFDSGVIIISDMDRGLFVVRPNAN
ncbi:MAG: choice-of-anchor B family protein [Proteobacteria bacterium]|nr:choice-of-anchor B family protein [Pseudomonadota bacterium]